MPSESEWKKHGSINSKVWLCGHAPVFVLFTIPFHQEWKKHSFYVCSYTQMKDILSFFWKYFPLSFFVDVNRNFDVWWCASPFVWWMATVFVFLCVYRDSWKASYDDDDGNIFGSSSFLGIQWDQKREKKIGNFLKHIFLGASAYKFRLNSFIFFSIIIINGCFFKKKQRSLWNYGLLISANDNNPRYYLHLMDIVNIVVCLFDIFCIRLHYSPSVTSFFHWYGWMNEWYMYAERENTSRISSTTHVCTIRIQYLFVCLDGWIDVMLDGQQQHQANIGPVLSIFFSLLSSLYDEYTKHFHYITLHYSAFAFQKKEHNLHIHTACAYREKTELNLKWNEWIIIISEFFFA